VILTPKAKGALSSDHPLFAGVIGLTRTDPVYEVVDEADCILAVGFDVVELVKPWNHPAPLIWVANWNNHDPKIRADVEIVGSMAHALKELETTTSLSESNWGEHRVRVHRQKYSTEPNENDPISPQQAMNVLRDILPRDTLVTTDVGSHKIFYCLDWPAYVADRFLVSNGLSSMGYGLPAAIAARLTLPETPVVCVTGDAGLVMMMSELNTLARLRTPVVVVVFKDHALDLIRSHQKRSGKRPFGTEFQAPDFVQIAAGHGIEARSVSDEDALAEAMRNALESSEPFLIEVEIDPSTYPTTPK
jgi:acetolactate synthase-1/2/3 large subunit